MARIIYGINAEGLGHAGRSKPIIDHLMKKHKVLILTDAKPYEFLSKLYPKNIKRIRGFNLVYEKNRINFPKTIDGLLKHPEKSKFIRNIIHIFRDFKPDIVISDLEPLTAYIARINLIPLISIDNICVYIVGNLKVRLRDIPSYILTKSLAHTWMPHAAYYFVCSFFDFRILKMFKKKARIIKPVIRDEIRRLKGSKEGDYILVYQTHENNEKLVEELSKINCKFHAYKVPPKKGVKNIVFKEVNADEFYKDLASCKAVITNGGFTLMSEALYLHKPVLSFPIKWTYEQKLNAIELQKLGFGENREHITPEVISDFIKNIPEYKANLAHYKGSGNKQLFAELDKLIPVLIKKSRKNIIIRTKKKIKKILSTNKK